MRNAWRSIKTLLMCRDGLLCYVQPDPDGDVTLIAPPWMRPQLELRFPDACLYPHPQAAKLPGWVHTTLSWAEWRLFQAQCPLVSEHPEQRLPGARLLERLARWAQTPQEEP